MAIGVAIAGFAHGHVSSYIEEWKTHTNWGIEVRWGWDHNAERLQKAVDQFALEPYDDLTKMLAQSEIAAVVIGSETAYHAELVEQAAAAGKAIILQKPLALTMAEADRIVHAVHLHQVPFTVAWQMRVDPQNGQIKQMIHEQALGKVLLVRRKHGLPMGLSAVFADSWHVDPALNRDIWADDASHPIDWMHWLLGMPDTVSAEVASLYNPRIPMDNGVAIFRYADGPLVEISCSFTCTATENTTEVVCEHGTIIQNFGDATSCNIPRSYEGPGLKWYEAATQTWHYSKIATPPNHGYRIRALAEPLAEFLHGKRPPLATAEEARLSLSLVLACYVSTREGRRVRVDDPAIVDV